MTRPLVIHGFETSNNMKVRVALGYKGIEHVFRTIDPARRDEVREISGQHLTPVMQHGDVVLFDSAAILRYLEANFPRTPRLFGRTRDEQWAIEDWELFARAVLAAPMMEVVHRRVSGGVVDDAMTQRCGAALADAVEHLATGLAGGDWLVGEAMTAADVTAAPVVHRIRSAGMLPLPAAADPLMPWVDRVMAHDAGAGGA